MKTVNLVKCLSGQMLTITTVSGVVLGVIAGLTLRATSDSPWNDREVMYINFLGDLFLRMLKGLILPLIISSLIAAIGSLDLSLSGRIGARAIAYYMITTFMAVVLGIILVTTIQPGIDRNPSDQPEEHRNTTTKFRNTTTTDTLLDLIRNMFPPNLVQACIAQFQTVLTPPAPGANGIGMMLFDIHSFIVNYCRKKGFFFCNLKVIHLFVRNNLLVVKMMPLSMSKRHFLDKNVFIGYCEKASLLIK